MTNEAGKGTLQTCLSEAWGGLEMVAFEFAQKLTARGFLVTTVCLEGSPLLHKCQLEGLDTLTVRRNARYFSPRCTLAVRSALRSGRYNSLLIQQMNELWQVVPALMGLPKIRLVAISHTFLNFSKKDWLHRWLYRRIYRLVALTELHKSNLLTFLPLSLDRVAVLPNAVNLNKFNPSRRCPILRTSMCAPGELLIGVIARLDLAKGLREVILVAERLASLNLPFRLILVGTETAGEPGAKAALEQEIKARGLKNKVLLTGHRSDVETVIASLDVLLMPSPSETFGRVLIEAMASGVAVVASRGGGVPDIVHDKRNGFLVEPLSIEGMTDAVATLLREPQTRALLAANGLREARERYDDRQIDQKLYAILGLTT